MTREVQHQVAAGKGALQFIHVDAPNVNVAPPAAPLALPHHIDSRPTPPPASASFGARRDHAAALRPERAPARPPRR